MYNIGSIITLSPNIARVYTVPPGGVKFFKALFNETDSQITISKKDISKRMEIYVSTDPRETRPYKGDNDSGKEQYDFTTEDNHSNEIILKKEDYQKLCKDLQTADPTKSFRDNYCSIFFSL